MLFADDLVELSATVEPIISNHGAYRGGPRIADFVARPDLEATRLEEQG